MFSPSQRIWGYETPDGSFAQFARVQDRQLMRRPKHLTWEESGCYVLTLATAYRMLFGSLFEELLNQSGDQGGRALLQSTRTA